MRDVTVSRAASADPVSVIDAIWSGVEWNARWEAISFFDVHYDDGTHQIAEIALEWHGVETRMELVRFRTEPSCIEFFCPRPPYPLAHQSGRWAVEMQGEQSTLIASRRIELARNPGETTVELELRLDRYAERLQERLSLILSLFVSGAQ